MLIDRSYRWFVLKPGMSDKGQGIRMFSTEDELYGRSHLTCVASVLISYLLQSTAIFESFEPESDDEEEEDEEEDDAPEKLSAGQDAEQIERMKKLALQDFPEDEESVGSEQVESDEEEDGTGVQTSQLRHFVIQVRRSQRLSVNVC